MDNKNKTLATKTFNLIKKSLADARKYNKENNFPINSWSRRRQQVDLSIWDNTTWKDGKKIVKNYFIELNNSKVGECLTHYDVSEVFSELRNLLNGQKKVKGWGGLNFNLESIELESGTWSGYRVSYIPKVCLADAPCSEYKSLMNFINKHGKTIYWGSTYGAVNLGNYELFSAAMGGKRGVLWDEYGERRFLDNKPTKCARLLEELRKARGSKDIMICKRGEENYIDPEEQRYSSYAEIECEGEKRKYITITIKTPTGKVKYEQKIY